MRGRRVVLTGVTDARLLEATSVAFRNAGCLVASRDALPSSSEGIDICVCFARGAPSAPLAGSQSDDWERSLERVLMGTVRLVREAARLMVAGSGGSIVIVGTIDATHSYPGRSVAAVAMGGLLGLVRSMGVELAGQGVRSNLVLVGPLGDGDGEAPADAVGPLLDRTLLRSPFHRLGRPEEAAAAIRFVASPDAEFMTGQTLRVDGGWASLNQAPEGMRFP
jgi:3-oxoacyl-[acyl-carrier protein] reductase